MARKSAAGMHVWRVGVVLALMGAFMAALALALAVQGAGKAWAADETYEVVVEVADVSAQRLGVGGTVSDGGDYASHLTDTFSAGTQVTLTAKPDKGYVFVGWQTNIGEGDDGTSSNVDVTDNPYKLTVNQNTLVFAKFQKEKHTVTFDSMGAAAVPSVVLNYGETVSSPDPEPTKNGFILLGWYLDKERTQEFDFQTPVTSDITLYAGWGYTVIVDIAGDTDYAEVSIDGDSPKSTAMKDVFEGNTVTITCTTPPQSIFVNLMCNETGKVVSTEPTYSFVFDGTMKSFVATYEANMTTVRYDLNGGHSGPNPPPPVLETRVGGVLAMDPVPDNLDSWASPPYGCVFDGVQIIDNENNAYDFKPGEKMEYTVVGPTVFKLMWTESKSSDATDGDGGDKAQDSGKNSGSTQSAGKSSSQTKARTPQTGDSLSGAMLLIVAAVSSLSVLALGAYRIRRSKE